MHACTLSEFGWVDAFFPFLPFFLPSFRMFLPSLLMSFLVLDTTRHAPSKRNRNPRCQMRRNVASQLYATHSTQKNRCGCVVSALHCISFRENASQKLRIVVVYISSFLLLRWRWRPYNWSTTILKNNRWQSCALGTWIKIIYPLKPEEELSYRDWSFISYCCATRHLQDQKQVIEAQSRKFQTQAEVIQ
jgi:hypothetical protein